MNRPLSRPRDGRGLRPGFPVALDACKEVLGRFPRRGAGGIPEAWVLDGGGVVVYQGPIEGSGPGGRTISYVREALGAVLSDRPVPVQTVPSLRRRPAEGHTLCQAARPWLNTARGVYLRVLFFS